MRISFQCLRAFCFVLFPALLLAVSANAQIDSSAKPTDDVSLNGIRGKKKAKGTGDRLVFSLNYSGLTALPAGISNQSLNRGFSYHSFSQKRFGIFAVAIGFGLSNANYYNTLTSYKPDAAQKFTA